MGKSNTKISLAVFCKGLPSILELQLQALKKQSLNPSLWGLVFIFKANTNSFLEKTFLESKKQIQKFFPSAQTLVLPSSQKVYEMRNLVFKEIQSPIIYFLDEDVILDKSNHLEATLKLHSAYPSVTAIGGSYLDHPVSSFFGQIYNWIVRLWMKKHQSSSKQDLLPAGNFSIKTDPKLSARFYSPNPSGFGAEELFFFQSLHKEGFLSSWIPDLDAKHLASHNFKDFVKRAWLQGQALPEKDWFSKRNFKVFLQEPAPFLYKCFALFYLFLVRLSAIQKKLF